MPAKNIENALHSAKAGARRPRTPARLTGKQTGAKLPFDRLLAMALERPAHLFFFRKLYASMRLHNALWVMDQLAAMGLGFYPVASRSAWAKLGFEVLPGTKPLSILDLVDGVPAFRRDMIAQVAVRTRHGDALPIPAVMKPWSLALTIRRAKLPTMPAAPAIAIIANGALGMSAPEFDRRAAAWLATAALDVADLETERLALCAELASSGMDADRACRIFQCVERIMAAGRERPTAARQAA